MGSIVSALTGGGSRSAADAQASAGAEGLAAQQAALGEQLGLGYEALQTQKDMFDKAISLGDPYRAAGTNALAQYESFLYGVPVAKTPTFQNLEYQQRVTAEKEAFKKTIPPNARKTGENTYSDDINHYKVGADGSIQVVRQESHENWRPYEPDFTPSEPPPMPLTDIGGDDVQQARMETLVKTPGYQFRMGEGEKALERSAAARSGILSGAQTKAMERYGQDYATNEFQNYLNRLGGLVDTGAAQANVGGQQAIQSGAQQGGILGNMAAYQGAYGQNAATQLSQIGAARASGYLGTQQAGANILNTAAGFFGSSFGGGGTTDLGGGGTTDLGGGGYITSGGVPVPGRKPI